MASSSASASSSSLPDLGTDIEDFLNNLSGSPNPAECGSPSTMFDNLYQEPLVAIGVSDMLPTTVAPAQAGPPPKKRRKQSKKEMVKSDYQTGDKAPDVNLAFNKTTGEVTHAMTIAVDDISFRVTTHLKTTASKKAGKVNVRVGKFTLAAFKETGGDATSTTRTEIGKEVHHEHAWTHTLHDRFTHTMEKPLWNTLQLSAYWTDSTFSQIKGILIHMMDKMKESLPDNAAFAQAADIAPSVFSLLLQGHLNKQEKQFPNSHIKVTFALAYAMSIFFHHDQLDTSEALVQKDQAMQDLNHVIANLFGYNSDIDSRDTSINQIIMTINKELEMESPGQHLGLKPMGLYGKQIANELKTAVRDMKFDGSILVANKSFGSQLVQGTEVYTLTRFVLSAFPTTYLLNEQQRSIHVHQLCTASKNIAILTAELDISKRQTAAAQEALAQEEEANISAQQSIQDIRSAPPVETQSQREANQRMFEQTQELLALQTQLAASNARIVEHQNDLSTLQGQYDILNQGIRTSADAATASAKMLRRGGRTINPPQRYGAL